jgi:hypothetical protein
VDTVAVRATSLADGVRVPLNDVNESLKAHSGPAGA